MNQGMFRFKIFLIFLFSYFLIFLFSLSSAWATTIFSPLLEIEAEPGEEQRGIVKIFNETEADLLLVSSIEPFKAGDEDGQPLYLAPEQKYAYLNWFKLDLDSLVLKSHQVVIIPFTVTVPKDATPGGYYAVIFWQDVPPQAEKDKVSVSGKVGTLIFLKVKGELIEKGEVLEFKTNPEKKYFWQLPVIFSTRFSNVGNIHLKPSGQIELTNSFGRKVILEINPSQRNVLPQSIRRFEVAWGKSEGGNFLVSFWPKLKEEISGLAFGQYTATLNLDYGSSNQQATSQSLSFWLIPIRSIIALLSLIIILIALVKFNSKIQKLKRQAKSPNVKR